MDPIRRGKSSRRLAEGPAMTADLADPRPANGDESDEAGRECGQRDGGAARSPDLVMQSVTTLSALRGLLRELRSRMTTDCD